MASIREGATLILFLGGMGGSPVEEMVAAARYAIAKDIMERAEQGGAFQRLILVTDREELRQELDPTAVVEPSPSPFHFGRALREVIGKHGIERPLYVGGGSLPLLPSRGLSAVAHQLSSSQNTVITNNIFSSDVVAFTPGKAVDSIEPPASDNLLAQLLVRQAGLKQLSLPRTAAYQFDVDSPADLLVLKLRPGLGGYTGDYVSSLDLDTSRVVKAMGCFADQNAEVLVAGRVGSHVWSQLEARTACRVRLLAEERGMRADGREERGEVSSILGFYLEAVGVRPFFATLARLGDAAFIDSRVLFSHLGLKPSRSDRFYSDLGEPQRIEDPFLRQFTQAAAEAAIPVVLGGHSLVSGGLLALIDIACPGVQC